MGVKYHCTTEKPARQPSLPASQLQILLQNTHVPYTERLKSSDVKLQSGPYVHKQQSASQRQGIHPTSAPANNTPISPQPPFINQISQTIDRCLAMDQWEHGSGSGMTRTLFFVIFVGNCHGFDICSLNTKSVWINIAPEKSFQSLRSLSRTMKAVNPTTRLFLS